jgi:two-component system C4-dicarboxylate transport sensor histidine kinase DctB
MYAFAPVSLGNFGVVFRWPWSTMYAELRHEVAATALILALGTVLVGLFGLAFAAYLARPLTQLGELARSIAAGEPSPVTGEVHASRDEIGDLYRAFERMQRKLGERDAKIREDVATIRGLNATLEQRVAERSAELEKAQRLLLDAERFAAMGKTAAAIAHELKNALNGLGMCVDLVLSDTPATAGTMRVRAQIHQEIARLRDVTESLLTFSRTPRIEKGPVDVHALIGRALESLREPIEEGKIAVEQQLAGAGAPLEVACDGHKVQGVMINLLKNAIESITTRPLDLSVPPATEPPTAPRRITIATRREDGGTVIDVCDSGPGLSDEARRRLFEPFFTTKVTGTGLGLATARRVIEAHGGTLEAAPAAVGALFRVRL